MLLKWSVWPRVRLSRLNHYWPSSFWHTITTTTLIHPFNDLFSRTIWASQHQKGKPFWILLQQQMMGWQWHQLDHMQITCSSLQTDNHASTSLLSFYRPDALLAAQPTASKHLKFSPVAVPERTAAAAAFCRQRTYRQGPWPEQSPCSDLWCQPPRLSTRRSAVLTCTELLRRSNKQSTFLTNTPASSTATAGQTWVSWLHYTGQPSTSTI